MKKTITSLLMMLFMITSSWSQSTGSCGYQLTWTFENNVLTISGTGAMTNYSIEAQRPWHTFCDDIVEVRVEEGVTSLGTYAFYNCINLERISLPTTLITIYQAVFTYCAKLKEIDLSPCVDMKKIISASFQYPNGLESIKFPPLLERIEGGAFSDCPSLKTIN